MKPKLRIFSNLARTGGTLVSRCIGCMEGVALLSEIHPVGAQIHSDFNILQQAVSWYGLFDAVPKTDQRYSFAEITRMIAEELDRKGLQLVIRDWVHLDFMAAPFVDKPYYHSRLVEALAPDFDIIQYHLVRHPVPQWLSTSQLAIMADKLPLEQYLEGYYRYALLCVENGFVRYEDFSREPAQYLQQICEHLDIRYDPAFVHKWPDYNKITGDTYGGDRRARYQYIKPALLPAVDASLYERLHQCEYYQQALDVLGYTDVQVK